MSTMSLPRRPFLVLAATFVAATLLPLSAPAARAEPRFKVECDFVRHKRVDPIVHPHHPGMGHLHAFLGNKRVRASSTYRGLLRAGTTCDVRADKSPYWVPALLRNGRVIRPIRGDFYYRGQTKLSAIRPFPKSLQIIAGNANARRRQSTRVVAWSCQGSSGTGTSRIRDCGSRNIKVMIKFPECWDGRRKDSRDHKSHMRYARRVNGRRVCPRSHPVEVPELTTTIIYPVNNGRGVRLSSGPYYTMHADFWNVWRQRALKRIINRCIKAGIECSGVSP
jgi:Domain of unknown function (DUF1996)